MMKTTMARVPSSPDHRVAMPNTSISPTMISRTGIAQPTTGAKSHGTIWYVRTDQMVESMSVALMIPATRRVPPRMIRARKPTQSRTLADRDDG